MAKNEAAVFLMVEPKSAFLQEIIFGLLWFNWRIGQLQHKPTTLPPNSTWYIMTKIPKVKSKQVGNLSGLRNWVEYGLKQSKDELGWADFRMTDYSQIQALVGSRDECLFDGKPSCQSFQPRANF